MAMCVCNSLSGCRCHGCPAAFPGVHILDNTTELSVVICFPESADAAYAVSSQLLCLHFLTVLDCCHAWYRLGK